jgi:hypothetical protein
MNSRILKILSDFAKLQSPDDKMEFAKNLGASILWIKDIGDVFRMWLEGSGIHEFRCLTPLGQNVGQFDMMFLKGLKGWPGQYFHYRCCEVGSLYATREGVQSLSSLSKELGSKIPGNPHEALYDARVALACAMKKWEQDEIILRELAELEHAAANRPADF